MKGNIFVVQIIERVQETFSYKVLYKKVWRAKHKAIALAFGNWESSYSILLIWLNVIQHLYSSTVVNYHYLSIESKGNQPSNMAYFCRCFWAFKPCIDVFQYLKPIIQIDGTHLYNKYQGKLSMVVSQDGDKDVVSLEFALVEEKCQDAYEWFLKNLKRNVTRNRLGNCLIMDRHQSIIAAINKEATGVATTSCVPCVLPSSYGHKSVRHDSYVKEKFYIISTFLLWLLLISDITDDF